MFFPVNFFLLQPCFDFAGTGDNFCYIHVLILLEPDTIFATSTHGGVGRRRRWLFFATTVSEFLLLPEMSFATIRVFFSVPTFFCYNHNFNFAGTTFSKDSTGCGDTEVLF